MSIPLLAAVSSSTEETVRPIADFHPTLWGNHFLKSAADVETIDAATQEQHAALKQEVRRMITTTANKLAQKLHMIDAVQRLGVAYHFEKEIEDELGKVSHDLDSDDLYVVSLRFRLFRQQGVKISCDVFEKFKDDEGKFKESLINDIRGMLSLYEAAYLAIRGEDILDEAIVFTTTHLKSVISVSDHSHVNSNLAEQIRHSLQIPLRKAAARLEASTPEGSKYHDQMQELIMLYFTEAKWLYKGYIPSFDEYKSVALRSIGFLPVAVASFVDLGDFIATKDNFECILKNAKSVKATQTIVRFMDDIAGYKFEQKRGHIPSAVECYKNQHGVSEEEAVKELLLEVADSWKDINEELLNPTTASLPTLQRVLYFARSGHFIYDDGHDRYTHSLMMKRQVALLLTEPLAI
ncbi:alpha-humulene/(-)-(E)-beta-caryophyllene synthase [Citrus sinensis]|nr:alpha-humulene/(-)-(E)-beta-caryophyllene synthase [Citrus sinensis]